MLITIGMFLEVAQEAVEGTDVTEVVTIDAAEVHFLSLRSWATRSRRSRSMCAIT